MLNVFSIAATLLVCLLPCCEKLLPAQGSNDAQSLMRIVELEVVADDRGRIGLQQEWMEALNETGIDRVRISTSRVTKGPSVEESESGGLVIIKLNGALNGRKIQLPGHEFDISDIDGIRAYVQQLRVDGAANTLAEKMGFGLTSEQLVDLHTELSFTLEEPTRGQNVGLAVESLRSRLKTPLVYGDSVKALLGDDSNVIKDELSGLSAGTSLAAMVRPLGLVVVPYRPQGGELQISIVPTENVDEHWPIGWPAEGNIGTIEPRLFDRIDVEIRAFKLSDALAAISGRIGLPIVYDYNSMARKEVDPETAIVTLVKPKQTYHSIVTYLCSKARPRLSAELRLDENGKPFFWVF